MRGLLLTLALALGAGCSNPDTPTRSESGGGVEVGLGGVAGDLSELDEVANDAGASQRRPIALGDKRYELVEVPAAGGALALYCDAIRSDADVRLSVAAAAFRPSGGGGEGALSAQGLSRGELFLVLPQERSAVYKAKGKRRHFLVYRRGEAGPELVALLQSQRGFPIDRAFPEGMRWSSVEKRVARAVKTGATLDQVREEVAFVQAVPFAEDREQAMGPFRIFVQEIEGRRQKIAAAWSEADLERRCELARRAAHLATASQDLGDPRPLQLAQRLREEVLGQLDAALAAAEQAEASFTRAGLSLARRSVTGEGLQGADFGPLLRAQVNALLPAIGGAAPASVDALYHGERPLGLRGLLARLGVGPTSRAEFAARAERPGQVLLAPLQADYRAQERTVNVPHDYTVPNPAYPRWLAAVNRVQQELQAAQRAVEANKDHTRRVLVKKTVYLNDPRAARGDNVREHYEIQTDEAMKARYRQAQWRVTQCEGQLRGLAAQEPPKRLPRRTTYPEHHQVWSGSAQRRVSLRLDGAGATIDQRVPAPKDKVRTPGWQGSDLREEHVAPSDGWTTAAKLTAIARQSVAETLGAELLPHLRRSLEARLARWVASRPAAARADEQRWAAYLIGLPLEDPVAARCAAGLGMER